MNVYFITNVPVPYRMDFFNELGKNCHLEVLFEQTPEEQTHRSLSWFNREAINFSSSYLYPPGKRKNHFAIIPHLRNNRDKLIVIGGYSLPAEIVAILWMRIHKVRFLLACDGGFVKEESFFRRLFKRLLISSASSYLSTGERTDSFLRFYGATGSIYRIPLTTLYIKDVATTLITDSEKKALRGQLGMSEEKIVVSVGQFIHRKGIDVLLNACKGLNNIGVYIIGGDPPAEYLHYKNAHSLHMVHFVGYKDKEELKAYYAAADVFVMPTREDIWGLVVIEAMATGLPVITTDKCLAGVELVDVCNGKVVPTDNPGALHEAIIEILSAGQRLQELSRVSLSRIGYQTIENMAKEYLRSFDDFEMNH